MCSTATYRVHVQGTLAETWLQWLGPDLVIEANADDSTGVVTTLTVQLCDQAALLGLLNSLYDANVPLLSVERIEPTAETEG